MPLYNYQCKSCAAEFEELRSIDSRKGAVCPKCESPAKLVVAAGSGRYHAFPEGWFEHIGPKPIYIETKKQLQQECKTHGCIATGLTGD